MKADKPKSQPKSDRKPAYEKKDPQAHEAWTRRKRERNAAIRETLGPELKFGAIGNFKHVHGSGGFISACDKCMEEYGQRVRDGN